MLEQLIAGFVERRHKLGKIEAIRHKARYNIGTRGWQSTSFDRFEGEKAVVSQLTGALTRAVLIMVLVATPSMLLMDVTTDTKQMVALVALFLGLLTFVEYNSTYPSLVEFRDAPPFNRIRFLMLFATVFFLSTIERGKIMPSTLTEFTDAVGTLIGVSMDFPYSPVRLATLMMAQGASPRAGRLGADGGGDGLSDLAGVAGGVLDCAEVRQLAVARAGVQCLDEPADL